MFDRRAHSLLLLTFVSVVPPACAVLPGGGGTSLEGEGTSGPRAEGTYHLAYGASTVESGAYLLGDTATIALDGEALGEARLPVEVSARLDLSLTFTDPDLRVAVRFREVEGRTGGAFGGSAVVTEEGIRGPLGFSLTPRGHVTLETLPEVDPDARQVIDPAALAREIFPRFPSHPVSPGERWVDTLTYETREEEGTLRAERVLTYTLRGDTTESGRTLLRIVSSGRTRYVFEGTRMGVETRQTLEGPVRGDLLWDPRARLPVRVRSEKELEGTMELPSLGAPSISLELQGITRAEWVGG